MILFYVVYIYVVSFEIYLGFGVSFVDKFRVGFYSGSLFSVSFDFDNVAIDQIFVYFG